MNIPFTCPKLMAMIFRSFFPQADNLHISTIFSGKKKETFKILSPEIFTQLYGGDGWGGVGWGGVGWGGVHACVCVCWGMGVGGGGRGSDILPACCLCLYIVIDEVT